MPVVNQISLKCDVCCLVEKTFRFKTRAEEEGWVILTLEGVLDRDFFDRVICPHCMKKLIPLVRKSKVEPDGVLAVMRERHKQISVKGYGSNHDDEHDACELVNVATDLLHGKEDRWGIFRKHQADRKKQLCIAAALICAEWDRLDRAEKRAAGKDDA